MTLSAINHVTHGVFDQYRWNSDVNQLYLDLAHDHTEPSDQRDEAARQQAGC